MARRRGRLGDYLMTSDYSGCTEYASRMVKDYWNDFGTQKEILKRNLQEISTPLEDPYPVPNYRGPSYEHTDKYTFEVQPVFIGKTTVPFKNTELTYLLNLFPTPYLIDDQGNYIRDDQGNRIYTP